MENKSDCLFPRLSQQVDLESTENQQQLSDILNLQKVVLQSFKYCQAKKSKNKYIRLKKLEEMKIYQKKLIAIIKKKSEDILQSLVDYSTQIISAEQTECHQVQKKQEESITKLKQKISSLKNIPFCLQRSQGEIIKQKMKRVTFECEEQLEKMEQQETERKTDEQIEKLINDMQRPFKKLCSYLALVSKQMTVNDQNETSSGKSNNLNKKLIQS